MKLRKIGASLTWDKKRFYLPLAVCCLTIAVFILAGCQLPLKPPPEKPAEVPEQEQVPSAEITQEKIDSDKDTLADEFEIKIASDPKIANTWEGYQIADEEIQTMSNGDPSWRNVKAWLETNEKNGVRRTLRIADTRYPVCVLEPPDTQKGIGPAGQDNGWILISDNYLYHGRPQKANKIYYEIYYNTLTSVIRVYFYPFQKPPSTSGLVTVKVKNRINNHVSAHRMLPLTFTSPESSGREIKIFFDQWQEKEWYKFEFPIMYMFDKNDFLEIAFLDVDKLDGRASIELHGKIVGFSKEISEETKHRVEISGGAQLIGGAVIPSITGKYTYEYTTRDTVKTYDMNLEAIGEAWVSLEVKKLIQAERIVPNRLEESFGYDRDLGFYYIEPIIPPGRTHAYPTLGMIGKGIGEEKYTVIYANAVLVRSQIEPAKNLRMKILFNPLFEKWRIREFSVSLIGQPEDKFKKGAEKTKLEISARDLAEWENDWERPFEYDLPEIILTKPFQATHCSEIKGFLVVDAEIVSKTPPRKIKVRLPFSGYLGCDSEVTIDEGNVMYTEFDVGVCFQECNPLLRDENCYISFEKIRSTVGDLKTPRKVKHYLNRKNEHYFIAEVKRAAFGLRKDKYPELVIGRIRMMREGSWKRAWRDETIAEANDVRINLSHLPHREKMVAVSVGQYELFLQMHFVDKSFHIILTPEYPPTNPWTVF